MNRTDATAITSTTQRTRLRQGSTSSNSLLTHKSSVNTKNDTPVTVLTPTSLVPGPYVPPPLLRHLLRPDFPFHPDDEPDHILAITTAILIRAANRAMSVKELGEAAYTQGYLRTRSLSFPSFLFLFFFPFFFPFFPFFFHFCSLTKAVFKL